MACKLSFWQNYWNLLAHTVPPFAARISRIIASVEAPGCGSGNA